jgi:hypothetical protein
MRGRDWVGSGSSGVVGGRPFDRHDLYEPLDECVEAGDL